MGSAAVVSGDQITGNCPVHQIVTPSGAPSPMSGMPFSSPLLQGLEASVHIGGQPTAVQGSSGTNTPPHVGLHASDPAISPTTQKGEVVTGSTTVRFGGKGAAYTGCPVRFCTSPVPGQLSGSGSTVMIGA